jgi:hypothetical protein
MAPSWDAVSGDYAAEDGWIKLHPTPRIIAAPL